MRPHSTAVSSRKRSGSPVLVVESNQTQSHPRSTVRSMMQNATKATCNTRRMPNTVSRECAMLRIWGSEWKPPDDPASIARMRAP
eukprot:7267283-Prymnesium_polylepis.2